MQGTIIIKLICLILPVSIMLQACSNKQTRQATTPTKSSTNNVQTDSIALKDRLAWLKKNNVTNDRGSEKLYTFRAKNLDIRKVLNLFAQAYSLNLVIDEEVQGTVSVNFRGLSFDQAMSAILDSKGLYWKKDGELVHIRSTETRVFNVDYIRLIRSGSGSSQAQVSSGSSDSSSGESSSDENTAGTMIIEQTDKVDFWKELEDQLKVLISKKGRIVSNRLAGTIQVTDQHRRVEEISRYIGQLNQAIYRQVDIEVKIVEITLRKDSQLGVDWSRVVSTVRTGPGRNNDLIMNNFVSDPAGGITPLPTALLFTSSETAADGANRMTAVLTALKEQGDVNIVSQPRIRTLNNQSALIKVGTDRTFFRKEQLTDTTSAGSQILSTDVPQVVTEGIVLAITPQISVDGWITMDISPVVTRVSSISQVEDVNGIIQSSAPNLDISQVSSLVRSKSGETIVIGGLIQSIDSDTARGIPGMQHIPLLGHLFKGNYKSKVRRELLMFVTPRLINNKSYSNVSSTDYE